MDPNPILGGGFIPSQHPSLPDDLNDLWDEALRDDDQQADDDDEDPLGLGGNMDDDDYSPPGATCGCAVAFESERCLPRYHRRGRSPHPRHQ